MKDDTLQKLALAMVGLFAIAVIVGGIIIPAAQGLVKLLELGF